MEASGWIPDSWRSQNWPCQLCGNGGNGKEYKNWPYICLADALSACMPGGPSGHCDTFGQPWGQHPCDYVNLYFVAWKIPFPHVQWTWHVCDGNGMRGSSSCCCPHNQKFECCGRSKAKCPFASNFTEPLHGLWIQCNWPIKDLQVAFFKMDIQICGFLKQQFGWSHQLFYDEMPSGMLICGIEYGEWMDWMWHDLANCWDCPKCWCGWITRRALWRRQKAKVWRTAGRSLNDVNFSVKMTFGKLCSKETNK